MKISSMHNLRCLCRHAVSVYPPVCLARSWMLLKLINTSSIF